MGDAYVKGVVSDYPWASLEGQTILDVGGGQGTLSIQLAKAYVCTARVLPTSIDQLGSQIPQTQVHHSGSSRSVGSG